MAGKIFINYRRDGAISTAGRLHDRLAQTFGRKNLFMDVDHIPAGVDFVEYLHSQVAACDVFLAVVGPNWLDAKDDSGRRRFENPDDFVTIEIAAALARNIRVIPVLVDGARTPKADRLPDSVKLLVRRNAVEIRNTQFGRDAEALANKIREVLEGTRPVTGRWPFLASVATWLMAPGRWRLVAGSATALLLVGWMGLYQIGVPVWVPWAADDPPRADKAKATADAEQRQAQAAADAEAKRKAAEAEQQRLAARAEEERKAQAEARAKAEQAEKERLAAAKAEEERRKQAEALLDQGDREFDTDRAIADYNEAIRLSPNYARAFFNRGNEYSRKGDTDRAIADYSEAIRLSPNDARAFYNRGNEYYRKGDNDRGIADYNEAIRLDPKYADAFYNRGYEYSRKGDTDRAIADYSEAIRKPQRRFRPLQPGHRLCEQRRLRPSYYRLQRGDPAKPQPRSRLSQPGRRLCEQRRHQPSYCRLQRGDPAKPQLRSCFLQSRKGEVEDQPSEW